MLESHVGDEQTQLPLAFQQIKATPGVMLPQVLGFVIGENLYLAHIMKQGAGGQLLHLGGGQPHIDARQSGHGADIQRMNVLLIVLGADIG
ncbi:hypothetical protein D3C75_1111500 [compost metagenome]